MPTVPSVPTEPPVPMTQRRPVPTTIATIATIATTMTNTTNTTIPMTRQNSDRTASYQVNRNGGIQPRSSRCGESSPRALLLSA